MTLKNLSPVRNSQEERVPKCPMYSSINPAVSKSGLCPFAEQLQSILERSKSKLEDGRILEAVSEAKSE